MPKLDSVKTLRFQLRGALDALEKLEKVSSLTAGELPILSMKGKHLYDGYLFHEVEVFLKDIASCCIPAPAVCHMFWLHQIICMENNMLSWNITTSIAQLSPHLIISDYSRLLKIACYTPRI